MSNFSHFSIKQQQVIDELQRNILLSAGAGTGKTSVLSYRIANILNKHQAEPSQILCLTFTNKACRELKHRVEQQVDFSAAKDIFIKTIHGFAYQLITNTAKSNQLAFRFKEFVIFDDEDQKALIREVIAKIPNAKSMDIQYIVDCIESLKQERALKNLYTDDLADDFTSIYHRHLQFNREFNQQHTDKLTKFFQCDGLKVIIAYETLLHQMNGLDYKDLIANAYRLLSDEQIRITWRNKYKYIMIDEMQDTSDFEYAMLQHLFSGRNVMLCGDIFQTIYEWRGSNPQHILNAFQREYNPLVIHFTENYRSTKILLEMAYNTLLRLFPKDAVENAYIKNMISKSTQRGHKIHFKQFSNPHQEAEWIFRNIVYLLPQVNSQSDIAILVRQNNYIHKLAVFLSRLSDEYNQQHSDNPINFIQIDNMRFFKRQEIKDVLAVLKFLVNSNDYFSLQRILVNLIPNIGRGTLRQITSPEYLEVGIRPSDFVYQNTDSSINGNVYEPFSKLIKYYLTGDIIVFDIEGTGTDVCSDNIVQLSAVRIHKGKKTATFDRYLQSEKAVGTSEKVHHISDDFLAKNGENPQNVLQEFSEFIKGALITGHNIRGYDMDMLNENLLRRKLPPIDFNGINFDTLDLSRRFYPNLPNHKLEYLSHHFNLETKSNHNSLDDVLATWNLLEKLLDERIIPTAKKRSELIKRQENKFCTVKDIFSKMRHKLLTDKTMSLEEMIALIVNTFDLKKVYKADSSVEGANRLQKLRQLYRLAKQELSSQTGIKAITELLQYAALSSSDLDAMTANRPKIPLITVHQAKGLEFQHVFLAGMNDDIFPSYFSTRNGIISDEEKRLFYVAVTRAKKDLYISSSANKSRLLAYIPEQFVDDE